MGGWISHVSAGWLVALAALAAAQVAAASPEAPPIEARRQACLGWLATGYPSGLEEISCRDAFNLPSPFLFECARRLRTGFRDRTQRAACIGFYARQIERLEQGYVRGARSD